jgi:hypothetical protein
MAYHLSVVEICHEINQQDTPPSSNPRTPEMSITLTNLSGEGVMPHVTEKMLGHELGGVMAVYNKHDWLVEQKDAYELYADKVYWHIKQLG